MFILAILTDLDKKNLYLYSLVKQLNYIGISCMSRENKIDELFSVFLHFRRHMHRKVVMQAHTNITVAQSELLFAIAKGATRLSEIAKAQNITPSAATQQLKLLAAADLVYSVESPDDRRQNILSLTEKGQKLLVQQRHIMKEYTREYLSRLSDTEIDDFILIMKKMIQPEIKQEEK